MNFNGSTNALEFLSKKFKHVDPMAKLDEVFGGSTDRLQDFHERLRALAPHKKLPHHGAFRFSECLQYRNRMMSILTSH